MSPSAPPSDGPSASNPVAQLRIWSWQLAEQGLGPFAGARALVGRLAQSGVGAGPDEVLQRLLKLEQRKQVAAAAVLAALSTVALPAGLPASLMATAVLDARLAMAVALVRGYSLDAPGVRDALLEAVEGAGGAGWARGAGQSAAAAGAALGWRAALDQLGPKALWRGRDLLLKHARGKWKGRLVPIARSLPLAGNVLMAAFEARASSDLARRVEAALARLPTEAVKQSAICHDSQQARRQSKKASARPTES